ATVRAPGRLAQMARAPRLHRGGRGFEPLTAHSPAPGETDTAAAPNHDDPLPEPPVSATPLATAVDAALEATVALSFSRVGYAVRSRLEGWEPVTELDGRGRTIVVTGANSGLGYATARTLLRTGARVVALVRSEDKGAATVAELRREVGGD